MRPTIKFALIFAGIWFLIKMTFYWLQLFQTAEGVKIHVMLNILCLLLAISIGTLVEKRGEDRSESSALGDMKSAMTGGMVYTIVVGAFIYLYYAKIDPSYNEAQIAQAEVAIKKDLEDPKMVKLFKEKNTEFEMLTNDEIYEKMRQGPRSMYSAGFTFTISLLGMMVLSAVNAIIVTIIYRRVLFRQRTL